MLVRLAHGARDGGSSQFLRRSAPSSRALAPSRWLLTVALAIAACGGSSAPAPQAPVDRPPLPPASGTPIGYLIDGAGELHLRDDQLAQLRQIDASLAGELDVIDTRLRGATAKPEDSAGPPPQSMGGGRSGRHGGGRGGMGGHGRHRSGGGGADSAAPHADPAAADRLTEERRSDVKDALARAFAILDATQQPAAKKILEDHDVDVEDGTAKPPPSDEPAGSEPGDPTEPGEP